MKQLPVSLVVTVKNEEKSLKDFFPSVLAQTRYPGEMIISDGGSSDGTWDLLLQFKRLAPFQVELLALPGANIARGRNEAIEKACYPVIAVTDAGCTLDRNWLREITAPFQLSETDVVSGRYIPEADTALQQCIAALTIPQSPYFTKFLPSGHSVAFSKRAWRQVGGYPQWLDYGEDTYFDLALRRNGCTFVLAPDAVVYWEQRRNLKALWKQFWRYSRGDGQAHVFTQIYRRLGFCWSGTAVGIITSAYLTPWLLLALVLAFVAYSIGLAKKKLPFTDMRVWLWGPAVLLVVRTAQVCGYALGSLERSTGRKGRGGK